MKRLALLSILLFVASSNMGCGDHDHDHENNHDHNNHKHKDGEEHVCVHFKNGPNVERTAVGAADGTLSESFEEHTRIDVTFPADSDTAYLKWTPEEAGDFEFWISKDVPLVLLDGTTALTAEETGGAAKGCETLAVKHFKFEVEAKKSYTLKIGPATAGEVIKFVAEHGAHEEGK